MYDYDYYMKKESRIGSLPCPHCPSSDACNYYTHDNSTYCFSCRRATNNEYSSIEDFYTILDQKGKGVTKRMSTNTKQNVVDMPQPNTIKGIFSPIPRRGLTQETCEKFGIRVDINGDTQEITQYHFPLYNADNVQVAVKHNTPATETQKKKFYIDGNIDEALLFGQTKFQHGWKAVTITEGEIDAASANQMLGIAAPCVSLKNGASSVKASLSNIITYDWLNSFDKIVVCTDNDEPGRKAASEIVDMFPPEKVCVMKMRLKDANDYLVQGRTEDFLRDWRSAQPQIPEGLKNLKDSRTYALEPAQIESVSYPWNRLQDLTKGIRMGEMTTITAGAGMGKTLIMCELIQHLLGQSNHNIGCLFLENSESKTVQDIVGTAMSYPIRFALQNKESFDSAVFEYDAKHGTGAFNRDRDAAMAKTVDSGRLWSLGDKDFACNDIDRVLSRIRYMAKVLNCKYIFLDHISIIVSSGEVGDERKALDEIATKLRMLVHELNVHLFMVSHSKRPNGKSHEEGGQTSLSELRGTAGIGQLSDTVLGLERNGQSEDERERTTTLIRVLKNRFAGITGPASYLKFNRDTYRLTETVSPEEQTAEIEDADVPVMDMTEFKH